MAKSRRKKNEEMKRRYEAIKNMMSTFAMSTVAVVAVVVLIPSSPKAEIIKATPLSEEVAYQVQVTDEDSSLDLDTLVVVLENQLEYYEQPITLGEYTGYFSELSSNTKYRLSVYGNKGFGQERLDTMFVTTEDKTGGTILSVTPVIGDHVSNYFADIYINDPEEIYSTLTLYYGYSVHPGEDITYSSVDILSSRIEIELIDIFAEDEFHVYLEATTVEGTVVLDEIWVTPPFQFFASVYVDYRNNNEIGLSFHSYDLLNGLEIECMLYVEDTLIKTKRSVNDPENHYGTNITLDNLDSNTIYLISCTAYYINPQTLRSESTLVFEEEHSTTHDYSYTYLSEIVGENVEITVVIEDPNHVMQVVDYYMRDSESMYLGSGSSPFTIIDDTKVTTFTILLPDSEDYEIIITISDETDYQIREVIDVIKNN